MAATATVDARVEPRHAPEHEMSRALDLAKALSEASLAAGARRRVRSTLHPAAGVTVVLVDQMTGYYLVPVTILRARSAGDPYRVGGWRVERVIPIPAVEEDDGEWQAPSQGIEILATTDTVEAAISQLLMDVHRQWLADALDEYVCHEYAR